MSQLILATYPTRAEAQTVAQMLAGAGLDPVVVGDDAGGAIPHLTMGTSGFGVSVPADQEEVAAGLLNPDWVDRSRGTAEPDLDFTAPLHRWLPVAAMAALAVVVLGIAFSILLS